jgi:CAAX protease family protein
VHSPADLEDVLPELLQLPQVVFCVGAVSLLLMLAVTFAFTRGWDRRPLSSVGFPVDARAGVQFLAGLVFGGALMGAIFAVEAGLGWLHIHQVFPFPRAVGHAVIWLGALLPAAAAEEVMLRGYTFQALAEQWGGTAATVITAILFGALHGINPHAGWGSFAGIVVSGILFGAAVLATGRLWLPIGLHVAWNLFEGPVLGFPVSGFVFPSDLTPVVTGPPLWTGGHFGPEAGLLGTLACAAGTLILLAITRGRANHHGDTETRRKAHGEPDFLQG